MHATLKPYADPEFWFHYRQAAQEQKAKEEAASQRAQQLAAVRKEWGVEFDENVRLGKRAVREFGLETSVEKLEAALGSADLLKLTAKLVRGIGARNEGGQLCRGQRSGSRPDQGRRKIGTGAVSEGKGLRDPLSGFFSPLTFQLRILMDCMFFS